MNKKQINERGLYQGWHAQQLLNKAKASQKTMAEVFRQQTSESFAFCVPGKCVKITKSWVHYEFLDGSLTRVPYPCAH